MRGSLPLVALLYASIASSAGAADTGIAGQKIILKVKGSTQKLVFSSNDPLVPFPPIGSADDPSLAGATIDIITPGQTGSLGLPRGMGNPGWRTKDAAVDSYTYKNGAVRSLTLKQGRTLKITGKNVPIALTAPLGSVAVRLTMGDTRACALFDPSTVVVDAAGNFTARSSSAPADCASSTLGGPAECGNDEIDPGEVCDGTAFNPDIFSCTTEFGPACRADCSGCCSVEVCDTASQCCAGRTCAPRIGPTVGQCRKPCAPSEGISGNPACDPGDVCMSNVCLTPHCSADSQCAPAQCLAGVCCMVVFGEMRCE